MNEKGYLAGDEWANDPHTRWRRWEFAIALGIVASLPTVYWAVERLRGGGGWLVSAAAVLLPFAAIACSTYAIRQRLDVSFEKNVWLPRIRRRRERAREERLRSYNEPPKA